ncbi:hypothetical protein K458DRAFT_209668 [Lentithecium fluviatile CBS 122367]|uniref:Uncharacterized protein n=1 Tax=Lentithecium fluviatile CBS 122367 TaxID=1168545 RepID=A0A6G1J7N8_9PLEO|nr:hypothetical protein K458DRAFT_209668 [Lentithecium fluviatile CBS 122367]
MYGPQISSPAVLKRNKLTAFPPPNFSAQQQYQPGCPSTLAFVCPCHIDLGHHHRTLGPARRSVAATGRPTSFQSPIPTSSICSHAQPSNNDQSPQHYHGARIENYICERQQRHASKLPARGCGSEAALRPFYFVLSARLGRLGGGVRRGFSLSHLFKGSGVGREWHPEPAKPFRAVKCGSMRLP